ncbi:MAG TPA: hypothetical protein VD695_07800 [Gaiellaceae bacterium]|nr:hypothetical protein [Gaiellaceae bacterium]
MDGGPSRPHHARGSPRSPRAGAFFGNEAGFDLFLELYSGEQTISIVADSEARALRAARALRPVDADRASTEDLPPPTIDVESGLAHCS